MRSSLRNTLSVGLAAAATASLVMIPAAPASAKVYYGKKTVKVWGITGKLDLDYRGKGKWYARGRFHNSERWNALFIVYLERRKGNGAWKTIGKAGVLRNGSRSYTTGWAWDGKGYKSRVCVEMHSNNGYHGRKCSGVA